MALLLDEHGRKQVQSPIPQELDKQTHAAVEKGICAYVLHSTLTALLTHTLQVAAGVSRSIHILANEPSLGE